jgi:hypothetical protein
MATPTNPTMLLNHFRFLNPQPIHAGTMARRLRPGAAMRGATHSRFGGLGWPRASLPLGASTHQDALNSSYNRMCLWACSVKVCT